MMSKKQTREAVFNKYGGKCAYCGCELEKGWHIDHLIPIRRIWKVKFDKDGHGYRAKKPDGCENPEHDTFENFMPACASCNINKHSLSLEEFRRLIQGFSKHLNEVSVQFKVSLRYGLVSNIDKPVIFYFEQINHG